MRALPTTTLFVASLRALAEFGADARELAEYLLVDDVGRERNDERAYPAQRLLHGKTGARLTHLTALRDLTSTPVSPSPKEDAR